MDTSLLSCPIDKSSLSLADESLIEQVNQKISLNEAINISGELLKEKLQAALIREDKKIIYPIVAGIPSLLPSEGIEVFKF